MGVHQRRSHSLLHTSLSSDPSTEPQSRNNQGHLHGNSSTRTEDLPPETSWVGFGPAHLETTVTLGGRPDVGRCLAVPRFRSHRHSCLGESWTSRERRGVQEQKGDRWRSSRGGPQELPDYDSTVVRLSTRGPSERQTKTVPEGPFLCVRESLPPSLCFRMKVWNRKVFRSPEDTVVVPLPPKEFLVQIYLLNGGKITSKT